MIHFLFGFKKTDLFFTDTTLKNLTQEVMELLKNTVGVEIFSYKYAIVHRDRKERSESRKRQKAIQVSKIIFLFVIRGYAFHIIVSPFISLTLIWQPV